MRKLATSHYDVAMRQLRCLIAVATLHLAACQAPTPTDPIDGDPALESLASVMVGSYSSAEQAKNDPEFRDIRMHIARVWPTRQDGPWLYVEQAAAGSLDKPYRQRIYRLVLSTDSKRSEGTIESLVFELPGDPLAFSGAWMNSSLFDSIRVSDLLPRDGCTIYLGQVDHLSWQGETGTDSCPNSLRGASYATTQMTITPTEVRLWDRGFDKDGKQVWGAVKAPYQFVKHDEVPVTAKPPTQGPKRDQAPPF